jgi:hypothetical protein
VPYFAWDNRAPGEMLVWLREGKAPLPAVARTGNAAARG